MGALQEPVPREDAVRFALLGSAATLLVVLGHAAHDWLEGADWRQSLLPGGVILLQMAALTGLHAWMGSSRLFLLVGAVVSALAGAAFELTHAQGALSVPGLGGVIIGLSFWGFWALAFRLPAVVQETRVRLLSVEALQREAELARIRSSLRPHFVLNPLDAIAALVSDEPAMARRLVIALGDLLRDAVASDQEVRALSLDVDWLRGYAEIMATRHDSVRFEWDLDEAALDVQLPRLLLQPLVENAVKHGVLKRPGGGVATVRARRLDGRVRLEVEDDGPGFPSDTPWGVGLRLVRERLAIACPGASLALESSARGTCASIEVPL